MLRDAKNEVSRAIYNWPYTVASLKLSLKCYSYQGNRMWAVCQA